METKGNKIFKKKIQDVLDVNVEGFTKDHNKVQTIT
jgi:hypothetical protein